MRRALVLALLASLLVFVAAACGGEDDRTTAPNTVVGSVPAETGGGDTGGGGGEGDAEAGAEVFDSAGCGSCHTFAAAGSTGTAGPNLDDLQPDFAAVQEQVTNGGGGMPAFKDQLSEQQIADVAAYVSENAGQ
jgi:mono/diheme cytochrome c family protein